ncbi:MAG: outer membrane beta-barrel protein, partial [Vicinamibacterales bacterium]
MTTKPMLPLSTLLVALLGIAPALAIAQDRVRPPGESASSATNTPSGEDTTGTGWPNSLIPMTSQGYAGISGGISDYGLPGCVPGASCDGTDIGFKVFAGGQINRPIGVEITYVDLGRLDRNGGDVRAKGVNLGVVANWALADQFSVFAKLGAVYGWTRTGSPLPGVASGNRSDLNLSYGAGAQYDIDRHWAVRADWDAYRLEFPTGRDTVSLLSLGGVYK